MVVNNEVLQIRLNRFFERKTLLSSTFKPGAGKKLGLDDEGFNELIAQATIHIPLNDLEVAVQKGLTFKFRSTNLAAGYVSPWSFYNKITFSTFGTGTGSHEFGHVISLRLPKRYVLELAEIYADTKKGTNGLEFISPYSSVDPSEFFAEAYAMDTGFIFNSACHSSSCDLFVGSSQAKDILRAKNPRLYDFVQKVKRDYSIESRFSPSSFYALLPPEKKAILIVGGVFETGLLISLFNLDELKKVIIE
jgi:hypothetical protein